MPIIENRQFLIPENANIAVLLSILRKKLTNFNNLNSTMGIFIFIEKPPKELKFENNNLNKNKFIFDEKINNKDNNKDNNENERYILPKSDASFKELYDIYKHDDGMLYFLYSGENVFG